MIIDSHQHWTPEYLVKNPEQFLWEQDSVVRNGDRIDIWRDGILLLPGLMREDAYSVDAKLKAMDEAGVDVAVLNADGIIEWLGLEQCRRLNDEMAAMVDGHPGRFVGLAHVPPTEEGCVEELDRAIHELGLKGVAIPTHVVREGLHLDNPRLGPFYQKVNELDVPIALHPANLPPEYEMFRDYDIARTFGRAVSVTTATLRLIQSDLLEAFPRLRFFVPHLGGTFFAVKDRAIASFLQFGGSPADFASRLSHLYFDTAPVFWQKPQMDCALATLGADRLVFGTDHPVGSDFLKRGIAALESWGFAPEVRQKVVCDNARALWGI